MLAHTSVPEVQPAGQGSEVTPGEKERCVILADSAAGEGPAGLGVPWQALEVT